MNETMEAVKPIQEASAEFFVPLYLAYFVGVGGWLVMSRLFPRCRPKSDPPPTDRRWLDFSTIFVAVGLLAFLSYLHRIGWLLPDGREGWRLVAWNVNMLIIYCPILLTPILRGQSFETLYLSRRNLLSKCAVGLVLGIVGVVIFQVARNDLRALPDLAWRMMAVHPFARFFLPVFLEGVAIAFLFVRCRWALGLWPALLIPAALFALGHVPNSLADGRSWSYIVSFFLLNTVLVAGILYVIQRSRDVIWVGIVHYMMDVAIRAF